MVQEQEKLLDEFHAIYREKERLKELEEQVIRLISEATQPKKHS